MSFSLSTPNASANAGSTSERGGFSICCQKVMFDWGTPTTEATTLINPESATIPQARWLSRPFNEMPVGRNAPDGRGRTPSSQPKRNIRVPNEREAAIVRLSPVQFYSQRGI
jgi:hypothetical protein